MNSSLTSLDFYKSIGSVATMWRGAFIWTCKLDVGNDFSKPLTRMTLFAHTFDTTHNHMTPAAKIVKTC